MTQFLKRAFGAVLGLAWCANAWSTETITYAGVAGATLIDSGVMVVTGGGPFDRTEAFEYVRRADGGITLTNSITAASGAYRVAARFDLDADWQSTRAIGTGLYDNKPVAINMVRDGNQVKISVAGESQNMAPIAVCDPDCFINMSPSITAMFVMTRHYDFKQGGEQEFRWAGQDLDRVRTLSGGKARLTFQKEKALRRADGTEITIRHFTFVEALPAADGSTFLLNFDMWTDTAHRPYGFRVRVPNATTSGVFGLRQGSDDIRAALIAN